MKAQEILNFMEDEEALPLFTIEQLQLAEAGFDSELSEGGLFVIASKKNMAMPVFLKLGGLEEDGEVSKFLKSYG